jgi:hypothetical protein
MRAPKASARIGEVSKAVANMRWFCHILLAFLQNRLAVHISGSGPPGCGALIQVKLAITMLDF